MLKFSVWTKFACVLCIVVSQVVNGGSSYKKSDGNGSSNSHSGSVTSTSFQSLPSSNIDAIATSYNVGEPKAIGNSWYQSYGSPYTVVTHQTPIARDAHVDAATPLGSYGVPAGGAGHEGGYSSGSPGGHGGGGVGGYGGGGVSGGYAGGGDAGHQMTYHYQLYPAAAGGGYGGSGGHGDVYHDDDDGGDSSSLGLLGLLGLKGLKGKKAVKAIKAVKAAGLLSPLLFPILLPVLLPILLPILAPILLLLAAPILFPLLLLGILFIPIPVLVNGRNLEMLKETAQIARNAVTAEECIERIACETFKFARGRGFDAPWVKSFVEKSKSQSKWIERVARGLNTMECEKHTCDQLSSLKKIPKPAKEQQQ